MPKYLGRPGWDEPMPSLGGSGSSRGGITVTAHLTPAGRARLKNVVKQVQINMNTELRKAMQRLKQEAASLAPGPNEEALILSKGVAADGVRAGQEVGVPTGGRFFRDGSMIPLREAILRSPITERTVKGMVVLDGVSAAWINARTGFSWHTKRRGLQGPTLPFNRAYVQTLENGGAVWTVTPRERDYDSANLAAIFGSGGAGKRSFTTVKKGLNPEPGNYTSEMIKTLEPRGMFRQARAFGLPVVDKSLRTACRQAGRAR